VTFGSAVAMGLPIGTAIVGLVTGAEHRHAAGPGGRGTDDGAGAATMIGLGVGIDYGLFVVSRHRDQLRGGMEISESIARTTATSGGAVLFAGFTVIIALLSLALSGIPLVTTLGYTSAIVVAVAVLAAITLMPALLSLLGARVNALRLPGMKIHHDDRPHGWQRWARFVADNPWPALVAGRPDPARARAAAAQPAPRADQRRRAAHDTQARQAYDRMKGGFGAGPNGPLLIAVRMTQPATNDQKQLDSSRSSSPTRRPSRRSRRRIRSSSRRRSWSRRASARPGAAAGPAAGVRPAEEAAAEAGPAGGAGQAAGEVPRVQGVRPAPADAAQGPAEDERRQVGLGAAGQQGRQRRGVHARLEQRAVIARDRGSRQPPARRRDPEGHEGQRDARRRRRHHRRATSTSPSRSPASSRS
jgi:hypothetical protein